MNMIVISDYERKNLDLVIFIRFKFTYKRCVDPWLSRYLPFSNSANRSNGQSFELTAHKNVAIKKNFRLGLFRILIDQNDSDWNTDSTFTYEQS